MPTTCVSKKKCNTHATGWLDGVHPTPQEGIVNRRVCFHWNSNCCNWEITIKVRNCGLFYVYRLVNLANCQLRYCVTNWELQEQIIHSFNSPLSSETTRRLDRVGFRKAFWDQLWGRTGQLLVNFCPCLLDGFRCLCESYLQPLCFSLVNWRIECLLLRLTVNIVQLMQLKSFFLINGPLVVQWKT